MIGCDDRIFFDFAESHDCAKVNHNFSFLSLRLRSCLLSLITAYITNTKQKKLELFRFGIVVISRNNSEVVVIDVSQPILFSKLTGLSTAIHQ